jgi:DNA modification methylase
MKTLYFPRTQSGTGKPERLSLSLNRLDPEGEFHGWVATRSADQLRSALGISYKELVNRSKNELESVSSCALKILLAVHETHARIVPGQLQLPFAGASPVDPRQHGKNGTFYDSKNAPISRWYPYLEGYSNAFVHSYIDELSDVSSGIVFDPFCGSGTTVLAASEMGWRGHYCEINPFMVEVIRIKTEVVPSLVHQRCDIAAAAHEAVQGAIASAPSFRNCSETLSRCFPGRPYFNPNQLVEFVALREHLQTSTINGGLRRVLLFALACIAIEASNLTRAGDVRYRRDSEMVPDDLSVYGLFLNKAHQIDADAPLAAEKYCSTPTLICPSILSLNGPLLRQYRNSLDIVVTSPPYLNGTNYIRNTKLELWTLGFIASEPDMSPLRRAAITAGINDVFAENRDVAPPQWVDDTAIELDAVAYDKRIPLMVRSYMSDALLWTATCAELLRPGCSAAIDIGDSIFAGIHVPTVEWIARACEQAGLVVTDIRNVRKRKSKNGSPLKQSVVVAKKPAGAKSRAGLKRSAKAGGVANLETISHQFAANLPYKQPSFVGRNWGNPLHSLCSYQGKLKPALAHFLVREFTSPNDSVLDPLSGAGTIPLECLLQGRRPIANDLQELAYVLSTAKCASLDVSTAIVALWEFIDWVETNAPLADVTSYSQFGFNGKISEYYDEMTYREILAGRAYLKRHIASGTMTWGRCVVASCWLHILHGNRPYALSRRSHPVTPFKPTGETVYRDTRSRLADKVNRALADFSEIPRTLEPASFLGNFQVLNSISLVDAVITSPPFANSTRFYIANWLRLWATGWEPADFKVRPADFIETKQKNGFSIYGSFLEQCRVWIKPGGVIVMHLGRTKKSSMADAIAEIANAKGMSVVAKFDECVASCEKFGVRDQGATFAHEFLVIQV